MKYTIDRNLNLTSINYIEIIKILRISEIKARSHHRHISVEGKKKLSHK